MGVCSNFWRTRLIGSAWSEGALSALQYIPREKLIGKDSASTEHVSAGSRFADFTNSAYRGGGDLCRENRKRKRRALSRRENLMIE